jgi:hypothetical protein
VSTDFEDDNLRGLVARARALQEEVKRRLPELAEARRRYARAFREEDRAELDHIEASVGDLSTRFKDVVDEMSKASGIPEEPLEALGEQGWREGAENRLARKDLVVGEVAITSMVETRLGEALQELLRLVPAKWFDTESGRDDAVGLAQGKSCLSLVKGLRPESELPTIHRFKQALRVTMDFAESRPAYDHFAGATLVPQTVQLGSRLAALREVGGDVMARIRMLWQGASDQVDSTVFELLVATACAARGRSVEFLDATSERSPDLRCHDPFPMVIECKRKRVLSRYELTEEAAMRQLFIELEAEALKKGMRGRFALRLNVEIEKAPVRDIVAALARQRLAPHPGRPLDYAWGSVAFHELPLRVRLPGYTPVYSPNMLAAVFGWDSDLPEWDGIVCRVNAEGQVATDEVAQAVGLVWSNVSPEALRKRSWSPLDLFGDAMGQIPPGEFGMVYLAYHEGAREEVADRRLQTFIDRMREWEHSATIRVPISYLVRLYPRPLKHGAPDLIESTVRLCSGAYGEPSLFEEFPAQVFTQDDESCLPDDRESAA